ncbi:hypothetical protein PARMER_00481 [Parabacteroides merdae ATCC 43184]|nr:hypothetical protein PARMER_00481 [Parabacteroides merdae ATCC 43184]
MILPVPVRANLFLAPELVFILGIFQYILIIKLYTL